MIFKRGPLQVATRFRLDSMWSYTQYSRGRLHFEISRRNSDFDYSHVAFVIRANLFALAASSISLYKRHGRVANSCKRTTHATRVDINFSQLSQLSREWKQSSIEMRSPYCDIWRYFDTFIRSQVLFHAMYELSAAANKIMEHHCAFYFGFE